MAEHGTAIEWTHIPGYKGETWNPVTGCDRVSPGCAHCYALTLAARLKRMGQPKYQRDGDPRSSGPGFGVTLHPDALEQPLKWRAPRAIFVNSMSDLFHQEIPDGFIDSVLEVIESCPQHAFLVLTKRPVRMRKFMHERFQCEGCLDTSWLGGEVGIGEGCPDCNWDRHPVEHEDEEGVRWQAVDLLAARTARAKLQLPNLWLGTSIENRRFVDRADLLRDTPAAVRFISAEPLLGPLIANGETAVEGEMHYDWPDLDHLDRADEYDGPGLNLGGIDWLIAGGESGPGHRPIRAEWVRALLHACKQFGEPPAKGSTAFFFKQWGGPKPTSGGRELDGRTWDEFPDTARRRTAE